MGLLDIFEGNYGANLIGCTIVRIRGWIWVPSPSAATVAARVGFKITDNRSPLDASENLYNQTEIGGAHDDWMGLFALASGPAAANISDNMTAREVDVKSSRRLDELGHRLEYHQSAFTGLAAADINIAHDLSVLILLP